jgi:acyl dehydratase
MSATEARQLKSINEYIDDLRIGDRVHSGRGRTITEADLVMFSAFSGDWASLHTDQEWVDKHGPFPGRIAHGCLTLSAATGLEFTMLPEQDKVLAFYGMDRVRFVKPVFIGDTIYTIKTDLDKRPKYKDMGMYRASYEVFKNEGELVLYCEHLQTVKYRDPERWQDQVEVKRS